MQPVKPVAVEPHHNTDIAAGKKQPSGFLSEHTLPFPKKKTQEYVQYKPVQARTVHTAKRLRRQVLYIFRIALSNSSGCVYFTWINAPGLKPKGLASVFGASPGAVFRSNRHSFAGGAIGKRTTQQKV